MTALQETLDLPQDAAGQSLAWLCGHTVGIDCASGQRRTTDFVTFDEAEAKAHVAKYKGSWTTEGWYRAIPVKVPDMKTPQSQQTPSGGSDDSLVRQFDSPTNRPGPYTVLSRDALHMVMDCDGDSILWSEKLEWCELAANCMNAQLPNKGSTPRCTVTGRAWNSGISRCSQNAQRPAPDCSDAGPW